METVFSPAGAQFLYHLTVTKLIYIRWNQWRGLPRGPQRQIYVLQEVLVFLRLTGSSLNTRAALEYLQTACRKAARRPTSLCRESPRWSAGPAGFIHLFRRGIKFHNRVTQTRVKMQRSEVLLWNAAAQLSGRSGTGDLSWRVWPSQSVSTHTHTHTRVRLESVDSYQMSQAEVAELVQIKPVYFDSKQMIS